MYQKINRVDEQTPIPMEYVYHLCLKYIVIQKYGIQLFIHAISLVWYKSEIEDFHQYPYVH